MSATLLFFYGSSILVLDSCDELIVCLCFIMMFVIVIIIIIIIDNIDDNDNKDYSNDDFHIYQ